MEGFTMPRAGLLCVLLLVGASAAGQTFVTPTPNTNIVGVTPDLANVPDFQLKQQQEPSCIVRPGNESYIFCAFNDLRASDLPAVQGDSWMGVSMSNDAGETWYSRLAPGYLGHTNSINQGFAADPSVVAIPGNSPGLAVLNYIAGVRGSSDSVLAIQRWVEYPQEDLDFWKAEDEVRIIADSTTDGGFIDKPSFHYIVDHPSAQSTMTESISVEGETSPISITTPTGTLIVVYTVFPDNSSGSKLLMRRSTDNGRTWSEAKLLAQSDEQEVTGASVTAIHNRIVVVYRRSAGSPSESSGSGGSGYSHSGDEDAIVAKVCFNDSDLSCHSSRTVFELCPFDQPASGSTFRTFSFPWIANDGDRFWVFAADRRFANDASCTPVPGAPGQFSGKPRIVGMTSTDGKTWVGNKYNKHDPFVVADRAEGFQVMPTAFGTKGRIDVAWYDTFREEVEGLPVGNNDLLVNDYSNGPQRVFRKADVFMTRLTADCSWWAWLKGCTPDIEDPVRVSLFPTVMETLNADFAQEVQADLKNLRMYSSGTLAFNGDYISLATPPFRKIASGKWIPNALPEGAKGPELPGYTNRENIYVSWGDNRDVEADFTGPSSTVQLPYTPPLNSEANPGGPVVNADDVDDEAFIEHPGVMVALDQGDDDPTLPGDLYSCTPGSFDFSRSRDSNIYGSLVRDQASLVAPTPTKPLGTIQRMFPLEINNIDSDVAQNFCLQIANQPNDFPTTGLASFLQLPSVAPFANGDELALLDVEVPAGSSASRAAFVSTSDASSAITVNAYEGLCPANASGPFGNLVNSVQLADGPLFDPEYCETNACEPVSSNETHNISLAGPVLQAPVFQAPSFQAPSFQAPVLQAPVLQAPSFQAPSFQAPSFQAPVLQAPSFQAPSFQAPVFQAPSLQAPVLQAGTPMGDAEQDEIFFVDTTYVVSADANVTTTYSTDIAVPGLNPDESIVQLIAWTPNIYTSTDGCFAVPMANQQILSYKQLTTAELQSVELPETFSASSQNPYAGELSFLAASDKDIAITVRIWATGGAAQALLDLEASGSGANQMIQFGASAHGCATPDAETNTMNPGMEDCLDNGNEKIEPDLTAPVLNLVADFDVEATSPSGATVNYTVTVTDNVDPAPILACTPESGTVFGLGANTVSCFAEDSSGNTANGFFTVTVVDTTPPALPSLPNITEEATSIAGAVVAFALPTATDIADADPSVVCTPASGSTFDLGDTTVTCTATDASGNSTDEDFEVTVADSQPPAIDSGSVPPSPYLVEANDASGWVHIPPMAELWDPVTATDTVDGTVDAVCTPGATDTFPLGDTSVICIATDAAGNASASVSFIVSVADTQEPEIDGLEPPTFDPAGPFVLDINANSFTVAWGPFNVSDADPAVTVSCVPGTLVGTAPPYTFQNSFPVGVTTVTCTASDTAGNTATAEFPVTILDETGPELVLAGDNPQSVEAGSPYVEAGVASAIDNADGDISGNVDIDASAVDSTIPGTYLVTYTSTDSSGNSTVINRTVNVVDTTAPTLSVPADILAEATGPLTTVALGTADADDFVGVSSLTNDAPAAFPVATTMVTWMASDAAGNTVTAMQNVVIQDTTPPVVSPVPDLLGVEATGPAGATVDFTNPMAADLVDGALMTACLPASGSQFGLGGPYLVTCSATDSNLNTGTTTFEVSVVDTTAPAVETLPDLLVEATGPDGAVATWASPAAMDIVEGAIASSCAPVSGSTFAVGGPHSVTCTATDGSGNVGTSDFSVTVEDTTAPDLFAEDIFVPLSSGGVEIDYAADVTATDLVDGQLTPACYIVNPDDPGDVSDNVIPRLFTNEGVYTASCSAADSAGNSATITFAIHIEFPYDIHLFTNKSATRPGRKIFVFWKYIDPDSGHSVPSYHTVDPVVSWIGPYASNDTSCSGPTDGSITGSADRSRFYYWSWFNKWKYGWRAPQEKGRYKLTVTPPGESVSAASVCLKVK